MKGGEEHEAGAGCSRAACGDHHHPYSLAPYIDKLRDTWHRKDCEQARYERLRKSSIVSYVRTMRVDGCQRSRSISPRRFGDTISFKPDHLTLQQVVAQVFAFRNSLESIKPHQHLTKYSYQMHIFHHQDQGTEEGKGQQEYCAICGRQLMERKGVLHRLTPISNAFVLNGYCLCHSDITAEQLNKNPKTLAGCHPDSATPQKRPQ
jgi:hypothetical protein